MSVSLERLARNQTLFREVNERIEEAVEGALGDGEGPIQFLCECSDPQCTATLELSVEEYERVRSNSTWFAIKRGHEIEEIESVVSEHNGYEVVEKFNGREFSERTDSRARG